MECPNCKSQLPEESSWCLYCGAFVNNNKGDGHSEPLTLDDANRLAEKGLLREAIIECTRIAEASSTEEKASALHFLGDLYYRQGNLQNAIKAYRQAIYLHSTEELRTKYDHAIESTRVQQNLDQPLPAIPRDRETTSEHKPTVSLIPATRINISPLLAGVFMGAAVTAVISSWFFIARPWAIPYIPPANTIPISDPVFSMPENAVELQESTTADVSTPMELAVLESTAVVQVPVVTAQKGVTQHYVKQADENPPVVPDSNLTPEIQ